MSQEEHDKLLQDTSLSPESHGSSATNVEAEATDSSVDENDTRVSSSQGPNISAEFQLHEPVTHYHSLSINYRFPNSSEVISGSAKIVEHDIGDANDFWNIQVDFIWRPRQAASKEGKGTAALKFSVDQFFVVKVNANPTDSVITIYLRGGRLLGDFYFPNGPDAAMQFVTAMRAHVKTIQLEKSPTTGKLFLIENKPRMRRVAPTLMTPTAQGNDDDFEKLLQDLDIQSATATQNSRRRQQGRPRLQSEEKRDGIMILSHFARITQALREAGDGVSMLVDERRRRAEAERRERERAARRRALDIYADIVASTDVERELPPRLTLDEKRGVPVSNAVWEDSFVDKGMLKDSIVMKLAIFYGGVEPDARSSVWPFILEVFPWDSTQEERISILQDLEVKFAKLKEEWESLRASAHAEDGESLAKDPEAISIDRRKRVSKEHATYLEIEDQIRKDIVRTDRTLELFAQDDAPATAVMGTILNVYASYDNRITYCQGMSDFLSPIIHVLGVEKEALAFWCFESLMRRIERNFRVDQSGMRSQLGRLKKLIEIADKELAAYFQESDPDYYSCFRWILVSFKREFSFEDIARFWEVLWTQQVAGDDLHIFAAGALLLAHRKQLLSLRRGAFDCLLRYVNDMCMRIDVDFAIREGELCFRKYGQKLI